MPVTDPEPNVLYVTEGPPLIDGQLPEGYVYDIWKPNVARAVPPTLPPITLLWSLFHFFGLFAGREYCVLFIRQGDEIVHRSCVLPRYFRWPFMAKQDLQVSGTWTAPKCQGRGLAALALAQIVGTMARAGRRFWYISRESNIASIRVCHKVGFRFHSYGVRLSRFQIRYLGFLKEVELPKTMKTKHGQRTDPGSGIAAWYCDYYLKAGADRNDIRRNPGALFQVLAMERSFVRAFSRIPLPPSDLRILDVGCGSGGSWYQFFRLGASPQSTVGIDLQMERLAQIPILYPKSLGVQADGLRLPFRAECFDLVHESTMFATIGDDEVRAGIAAEMLRVCRPHGYVLLVDWRIGKFWDSRYKALSRSEVRKLFGMGKMTKLVGVGRGALLPPIGRFLSAHAESLYFLCASLFSPLVGQVTYLLQKVCEPCDKA
jgi:ubiquinone/menaquinone biosynthesis C-methylase UbiE